MTAAWMMTVIAAATAAACASSSPRKSPPRLPDNVRLPTPFPTDAIETIAATLQAIDRRDCVALGDLAGHPFEYPDDRVVPIDEWPAFCALFVADHAHRIGPCDAFRSSDFD